MAKRRAVGRALKRTLAKGQFTKTRLQSGKYTKFKSGRNLIFEVWETRLVPQRYVRGPKKGRVNTKKPKIRKQVFVRFLNQLDKKKNPIPRKYTAIQYRFLTAKVTREKFIPKPLSLNVTIEFNNKSLLVDQILMKKGDKLKNYIRKFKADLLVLNSRIKTDRGDDLSGPGVVVSPSTPWPQTAQIIVMNLVYGPLSEASIRVSPKKFQRQKANQMKKIWVTFTASKP